MFFRSTAIIFLLILGIASTVHAVNAADIPDPDQLIEMRNSFQKKQVETQFKNLTEYKDKLDALERKFLEKNDSVSLFSVKTEKRKILKEIEQVSQELLTHKTKAAPKKTVDSTKRPDRKPAEKRTKTTQKEQPAEVAKKEVKPLPKSEKAAELKKPANTAPSIAAAKTQAKPPIAATKPDAKSATANVTAAAKTGSKPASQKEVRAAKPLPKTETNSVLAEKTKMKTPAAGKPQTASAPGKTTSAKAMPIPKPVIAPVAAPAAKTVTATIAAATAVSAVTDAPAPKPAAKTTPPSQKALPTIKPLPIIKPAPTVMREPVIHISNLKGIAGSPDFSLNNIYVFKLESTGKKSTVKFYASGRRTTDTYGNVWLVGVDGKKNKIYKWSPADFSLPAMDAKNYSEINPIVLDVSPFVTKPGKYEIEFEYTDGIDALGILRVEFIS